MAMTKLELDMDVVGRILKRAYEEGGNINNDGPKFRNLSAKGVLMSGAEWSRITKEYSR